MAKRMPNDRNRDVDFLRAAAIAVVLGHWLRTVSYVDNGELQFDNLLHAAPWTQWSTWVYQVMPIIFMAGGYANAASWESARRRGFGYGWWMTNRLHRLIGPVLPLVVVWGRLSITADEVGIDAHSVYNRPLIQVE
jgi:hypothetical protein